MNSQYHSIIVDYIDLTDCDFQYTLEWYRDNGFELNEEEMMFYNYNTPRCFTKDGSTDEINDTFLEYLMRTNSQLDWVIDNWDDAYWRNLSMNEFMTVDMWRRILSRHSVPNEHLSCVLKHKYFPWFELGRQLVDVDPQDFDCNHLIIDPKRSPTNNDWFWEKYRKNNVCWNLSGNQTVTADFWKRHAYGFFVFEYASTNPVLDETFWRQVIEKYPSVQHGDLLSGHPSLSVTFWEEYLDKVDWKRLCRSNQVLTTLFLLKHLDRIEWTEIVWNKSIPMEFWVAYAATDYPDMLSNLDLTGLSENSNVSTKFIEECISEHSNDHWETQHTRCSLSFWEEYMGDYEDIRYELDANPYVLELVMKRELCQFLSSE